jgi:hypothetical protein
LRTFLRIIALSAATIVAGCASGPNIRVDKDPAVDLKTYKTFGFFERPATDRGRYSTLMTARLQHATRQELERLGYSYDQRSPHLRVNFFVNIGERQEIRSTPAPSGFYRYRGYAAWGGYPNVETVQYKAGTLSIDLVDAKQNRLVWQGLAEGKVPRDAAKNPDAAVDAVVEEIFRKFPSSPST